MARFKNKKGGICEVYSLDNIEKFRKDKNYIEINEKRSQMEAKPSDTTNSNKLEESGKESNK